MYISGFISCFIVLLFCSFVDFCFERMTYRDITIDIKTYGIYIDNANELYCKKMEKNDD